MSYDIDITTAINWMVSFSFKASARTIIEYMLFQKQWINTYDTSAKRLTVIVQNLAMAAMNDLIPVFLDQIMFNITQVVLDGFLKWFMNEIDSNSQWINMIDTVPLTQIFLVILRRKNDLFDVYHFECQHALNLYILGEVYRNVLEMRDTEGKKERHHLKKFIQRIDQKWDMEIKTLTEKRNQLQSFLAEEMLQTTGLQ